MMRTIERNSREDTKKAEMKKMIDDFVRSGYNLQDLKRIEQKAITQFNRERTTIEENNTITFPIFYFNEINQFKKIIHDAKEDLQQAIGNTKVIMAVKKNPSIGNGVVQNKRSTSWESEMWITELSTVSPSQHKQRNSCQQHSSKTIKNVELQIKKCDIPVAVPNLPGGKQLLWTNNSKNT